ncbi:hypothetical protein BUE76_04145 [Cnuella takakiae]|nr:hypothetical protein BUE76_04145 [Cnuella takakiae]
MRVTDNGSPVLADEEVITITVTAPAIATTTAAMEQREMAAALPETAKPAASLYPNPVHSRFTVALDAPVAQIQATIFDVKGSVLYTGKQAGGRQFQLDASALPAGQYFLRLDTPSGSQVLKFVKQ